MAIENRRLILDMIGLAEGGYSNHPADNGGPTDRGITQGTYDAWNRLKGHPRKPVKGISKDEAEEIIEAQFMETVRYRDLPGGLDLAVVDYGVNSGPGRAIQDLQRVVGVRPDGVIGAMTLAAVAQADTAATIRALADRRMAYLRRLSDWRHFGTGWTARVQTVTARALELAHGQPLGLFAFAGGAERAAPPAPATPAKDAQANGVLLGLGGAVTAAAPAVSAIGTLDPAAQIAVVAGLVVAVLALAVVYRRRLRDLAE